MKNSKGITLISLVITIIVLLILAAISLTLLLGDNGIIIRAGEAEEETKYATAEEKVKLSILASYNENGKIDDKDLLNELLNKINATVKGYDYSEITDINADISNNYPIVTTVDGYEFEITNDGSMDLFKELPKVLDSKNKVLSKEENTIVEDQYRNKIKVPAGFKIVLGDDVTDGIVIEDEIGNQFVWVPVGNIKDGTEIDKEITLSRYVFDSSGKAYSIDLEEEIAVSYVNVIESDEQLQGNNNEVAKDLEGFINKTNDSKGYYIGRYESSGHRIQYNLDVSNGVSQVVASQTAKTMYSDNSNYTSDLINSLAWDTALVFIQTFSEDKAYSIKRRTYTTKVKAGQSPDHECNIHDLAGNLVEWTTESTTYAQYSGIWRGGEYSHSYRPSSGRYYGDAVKSGVSGGFRAILYL